MSEQKPSCALDRAGASLWSDVTSKYDLRVDELAVLEKACRASDRLAAMSSLLADEPLMVNGSMGQPVVHPLVAEIRATEALVAQLLGRLKLPDAPGESGAEGSRSTQARAAAQSRWAAAHGKGA